MLDGLEATTYWNSMTSCSAHGVTAIDDRRVVPQGKVVTAAGVSAGIDMALWLAAQIAGDDIAKAIQLGIEYDPQPPFDSGSVAKADPDLVTFLRALLADGTSARPTPTPAAPHAGGDDCGGVSRGNRLRPPQVRDVHRALDPAGSGAGHAVAGAGAGEAGVGRVDRPGARPRPTVVVDDVPQRQAAHRTVAALGHARA